jgi:hypothetical protein
MTYDMNFKDIQIEQLRIKINKLESLIGSLQKEVDSMIDSEEVKLEKTLFMLPFTDGELKSIYQFGALQQEHMIEQFVKIQKSLKEIINSGDKPVEI